MAFSKITDEDRLGKGNVGQPDTPGLTTAEMQAVMDELPNLAIDKFNAHIDELEAATAAANIGAAVPEGLTANNKLQSIINALHTMIKSVDNVKHSHANKTLLDAITEDVKSGYDRIALLFKNITSVGTSITNSNSTVPTSAAVKNYADNLSINEKVVNAAYPIGSVYSGTSNINPSGILGTGTWTQIGEPDEYGVYRFRRQS
jgi:uncharacterized protein YoxC